MNKKMILAGVVLLIGAGLVTAIAVMVNANSLTEANFDHKSVNLNLPVEPKAASSSEGDSTVQQPPEPNSQDFNEASDSDQSANSKTDDPQGNDQNDSDSDNVVKP